MAFGNPVVVAVWKVVTQATGPEVVELCDLKVTRPMFMWVLYEVRAEVSKWARAQMVQAA